MANVLKLIRNMTKPSNKHGIETGFPRVYKGSSMTPRQQRIKSKRIKIGLLLAVPSLVWLGFVIFFVMQPELFDKYVP